MESKTFKQSQRNSGIKTNYPTTEVDWCIGRNVRFLPGAIAKDLGKELLVSGVAPVRAVFTFKGHDGAVRTIKCTDNAIMSYTNDFASVQDITPTVAPAEVNASWQIELVAGLLVITNGVDGLWIWSNYASEVVLTAIPAKGGNMGTIQLLGKSMNRLLIGDYIENGGAWEARVRWSDIAKPVSFAEGVTNTNGYGDLVDPMESEETSEKILKYSNIGKRTIIFTNQNIWFMDPVEAPRDYSCTIGAGGYGLLASGLVVKTDKRSLFFVGKEDFYLFSGGSPKAIGFDIRNSCFPNLNKAALESSFSYYKPSTKEVYFCVPTGSNTSPDTAFVYQLETRAWSIKDVDYTCFTHAYDNQAYTWDDNPFGDWSTPGDSRWDEMTKNGVIPYGVVGSADGCLYKVDTGHNNVNSAIYGYIETGDMDFGSFIRDKHFEEVWPIIKPQDEARPLMIQVGTRESMHHDLKWSNQRPVNIGSGLKACFRNSGKYGRLRLFTEVKDSPFVLEGFKVIYFNGGTGR
ncbi:MAG: hypothetical protein KAV87_37325 [Desulfobacteraceae bacterium]|nr:hypothetical protein [Desulfobacteraceae bacterium]